MKHANSLLPECLKKSLKHHVEELKERDDFEVKIFHMECVECGQTFKVPKFKIYHQHEWKLPSENQQPQCKDCIDYKEIPKVLEAKKLCLKERRINYFEENYWYIPEDLKNAGFRNFEANNANVLQSKKAAMEYVKTFSELNAETRYNLLIMGNPGAGKTHLVTAISRTLKEQGFCVAQLTTGRLLSKIKSTYHKGSVRTEEEIFDDLRRFDLLVLDDLGSEARSKEEFDWSKNILLEIVNIRLGKPTIYTSNFNQQHLPTAIGERVYSRLYNNTKFLEIVTEDYRKNFLIS
ncbi:ATP-binding protein [Priestia megaterium]|uniref:ATP-binding protein n=1 Tax=Priestia megaterium TaxID=1404 RepID=UPI00317BB5C0